MLPRKIGIVKYILTVCLILYIFNQPKQTSDCSFSFWAVIYFLKRERKTKAKQTNKQTNKNSEYGTNTDGKNCQTANKKHPIFSVAC